MGHGKFERNRMNMNDVYRFSYELNTTGNSGKQAAIALHHLNMQFKISLFTNASVNSINVIFLLAKKGYFFIGMPIIIHDSLQTLLYCLAVSFTVHCKHAANSYARLLFKKKCILESSFK